MIKIEIVKFKNKKSNLFLDVKLDDEENGAKIIQWTNKNQDNQRFLLFPVNKDNNQYIIVSKHSGKVLEVEGGSEDDGANIIQSRYTGEDNQIFSLEASTEKNYFIIRAKHSGKVIDIYDCNILPWDNHGMNPGTVAVQYTNNTGDNQIFYKKRLKDKAIEIPLRQDTTWLPFFVVKDKKLTLEQQVQKSPYYLLQRENHYEQIVYRNNEAEEDEIYTKTIRWSNSVEYMNSWSKEIIKTKSFKVRNSTKIRKGTETEYLLNNLTLEFGSSISRNISNEISLKRISTKYEEDRHEFKIKPKHTIDAKWIHDKISLKRMDGSEVTNPLIIKRNKIEAIQKPY